MKETEEKKEPLFELTEIPETPFMLMHNENGYAILFAEYQITKYYESKEEIKKLIDEKNWDLIFGAIITGVKIVEKINKEQEIINNNKEEEICK